MFFPTSHPGGEAAWATKGHVCFPPDSSGLRPGVHVCDIPLIPPFHHPLQTPPSTCGDHWCPSEGGHLDLIETLVLEYQQPFFFLGIFDWCNQTVLQTVLHNSDNWCKCHACVASTISLGATSEGAGQFWRDIKPSCISNCKTCPNHYVDETPSFTGTLQALWVIFFCSWLLSQPSLNNSSPPPSKRRRRPSPAWSRAPATSWPISCSARGLAAREHPSLAVACGTWAIAELPPVSVAWAKPHSGWGVAGLTARLCRLIDQYRDPVQDGARRVAVPLARNGLALVFLAHYGNRADEQPGG